MKAMARTSSMTKLGSNQDNNMKSQAIWSESILAQLESIPQDDNISSNYSIESLSSENKSQQSNQWKESTLAAGMVVEEKEEQQEEIPIITPISSEEEETKSPSSLSPSSAFQDDKENAKSGLKVDAMSSSSKSTSAISKARKQKRIKAKKYGDDDAQSVASNISRLRAKQKLLRLHSANKLAESRRRLSLQQQSMPGGYQYLSNRDASSVTSRTTLSEWSAMHQTPVHRRSSIPRQVLISESASLYDLRQSPVHESKDTLTVTTESERILQERLSKVQDELVGTKQMIKLMFAVLVLTAMGMIFHDDILQVVRHSRSGALPLAPPVALGKQMQASTVGMDIKFIPQLPTDETDCSHQGDSCENIQGGIVRSAGAHDADGEESLNNSKAKKKAILDRAQRILKSKGNEFSLDTRNPDYIGLLLSQ